MAFITGKSPRLELPDIAIAAGTNRALRCAGVGDLWRIPMAEHLRTAQRTAISLTPARVMTGVVVFALGILAGAGIAAWLMPPA
jgi:hypothetical protein